MGTLYRVAISLFLPLSKVVALFSKSLDKFVTSRKGVLEEIEREMAESPKREGVSRYWFHCASVGEFEQARPLIERIKRGKVDNGSEIIITFFSPSGYNLRKEYSYADHVFYLPIDKRSYSSRFVDAVNPDFVLFIKYEFWYNILNEVSRRGIPLYLVSASFMESQPFFKWWGGFFRKMLSMFNHIFVQDFASVQMLEKIGVTEVTSAGDTRIDRVLKILDNDATIEELHYFVGKGREEKTHLSTLVAGSTWPGDDEMLSNFYHRFLGEREVRLKLIVAPHEIDEEQIFQLKSYFKKYKVVRYSEVLGKVAGNSELQEELYQADIFIIDTVGKLSTAYRYGDVAYVGGGFGAGIHNILEPVVYGMPVVFGPNFKRFIEASGLISCGAAYSIINIEGYMQGHVDVLSSLLVHQVERDRAAKQAQWYIEKNRGATDKILNYLGEKFPDVVTWS